MSTYDDSLLSARFALLAPKPIAGDWEDVCSKAAVPRRSDRRRLLMIAAPAMAAAMAIVVALFVSSPWQSAPGFLERAEAALTPPEGTILHYKLETSRISTKFGCTVTGPYEMWVDTTPPHRWRAIKVRGAPPGNPALHRTADPRTLACSDWGAHEIGAPSNVLGTLEFVPPSTLRVAPLQERFQPVDHVAFIRDEISQALADGRAHNEGMTEIDGHSVFRYRLDCRVTPCPRPSYVYMDPETSLPLKTESPNAFRLFLDARKFLAFDIVDRYFTIEYLPRTPENLALTDIRAQHPDAKGP
jgi:hypothetical protein